mmetsp:Transcript_23980/g.73443  ORF Transcript_23980/g.73443 Transcript_23980/m.73443 type:complete len:238 (+) Transcript_23980:130-843(+)
MNGDGVAPEEAQLASEIAWLKQQIPSLTSSLSQLQQQHAALTAQATQQTAGAYMGGGGQPDGAAGTPTRSASTSHSSAWTEQMHPENGHVYYWNSVTGESTYTRPADYQPAEGGTGTAVGLPQTKGPPGANLFVVRKMRRGEYDTFNSEDLRREFSRYGTVTRAEITIDKDTGWSKGFGFVSFDSVEAADAALAAIHGSWMDGREMKVEKTKEDHSGGQPAGGTAFMAGYGYDPTGY